MKVDVKDKALRAALCDLFRAALREKSGKTLRPMIRRIATRFLTEDTVAKCKSEVALSVEC